MEGDTNEANRNIPEACQVPWFGPTYTGTGYVPELAYSHPQTGRDDLSAMDYSPLYVPEPPALFRAVDSEDEAQGPYRMPFPEEIAKEGLSDKIYAGLGPKHGTPTGDLVSWISHAVITKVMIDVIEKVCDHYGLDRKETIALNVALFFTYREVCEPDGFNLDSVMDVLLPAAVAAAEILWEER